MTIFPMKQSTMSPRAGTSYRLIRRATCCVLAVFVSIGFTAPATAWSFKEHILVTRLAVQRLLADKQTPEAMKKWLREASPNVGDAASAKKLLVAEYIGPKPEGLVGLDYWCIFPDIARSVDGDAPVWPFGTPEAPMHFFDLEYLNPDPADQKYAHDLSNKPSFEEIPRDWRDRRLIRAGYLPYRVEQVYDDLVKAIRDNRLRPGNVDDRDNALVLAGYLAHYLADNTQPQHATADYKSASYFVDPKKAPNVHGMFEYGMVDWEGHDFPELREALWAKLQILLDGPREIHDEQLREAFGTDPWESTVRVSMMSYDALPLIGVAAQKAAGQGVEGDDATRPSGAPVRSGDEFDIAIFFRTTGNYNGAQMSLLDIKAQQLGIATLRIESILQQAWNDAHDVPRPKSFKPTTEPSTQPSQWQKR